jgi:hypothetical protein
MMYYRIAWKSNRSSVWQWKSPELASLAAVFHLLRIQRGIPLDHLRVFSSSSCEGLQEQLEYENQGGQHTSVTAEQFLRERGIHADKVTGGASEQRGSGTPENQEKKAITATLPPVLNQSNAPDASVDGKGSSVFDKRRWEREMGAGGDHDLPYTFALPLSQPQTLAWIRLMTSVQRGELEP